MNHKLLVFLATTLFIYTTNKPQTEIGLEREPVNGTEILTTRSTKFSPASRKTCNRECKNSCGLDCSTCSYKCGTTVFIPRSQGTNTARELVEWQDQLYRPYCENYTALAGVVEYTHSIQSKKLARELFCTDCLTFAGSQAKGRNNKTDIIADYFGLPVHFKGTLKIDPTIKNEIVDLEGYLSLPDIIPGLYARFNAPITYTTWDLGLNECIVCDNKEAGNHNYPLAYMFSGAVEPAEDECPFITEPNAFHIPNNCSTNSLRKALSGDFLFGDIEQKWDYGKFSFCPRSKLRLADLDLIVGYNLLATDYGHFGLYVQAIVPTGNRPNGKYFFQPIVGNGKHWELGGGVSTHIVFFNTASAPDTNEGASLALYIEGNMTHLFKNHQIRAFDFKTNGLLSRYMLLKEYDLNHDFTGKMINAINFCTRNSEVYVPYRIDLSAKFCLRTGGWTTDLGYNFYIRDQEKVCIKTNCPCPIDQLRLGIKGTQGVSCLKASINDNEVTTYGLEPLNATEPKSNMFKVVVPERVNYTDMDIEDICLAYNNNLKTEDRVALKPEGLIPASKIPPKLISCADLDVNSGAQSRMITNKFFWDIGYEWYRHDYSPHVGIGGEIEIAPSNIRALSQYGIWIKAGAFF